MNLKARNKLIEGCVGIAKHLSSKQALRSHVSYDDLLSQAYIILIKCAEKYDKTKGKFSSYAFSSIEKNLREYVHKEIMKSKALSNEKVEIVDPSDKPDVLLSGIEEHESLYKNLECLTLEEKKLINLRYFKDLTLKEIAKKYGTSIGDIHYRLVKILTKLKGKFQS